MIKSLRVPIALKHANDIVESIDPDVFKYMAMPYSVITPDEVRRHIELQGSQPNTVAFAVIDNETGRAIGSSSYLNITPDQWPTVRDGLLARIHA